MGYIFEHEIERILNTVRARTIGEAESIKLRDVLAAPVHPALKAYFRAEVVAALADERTREVRSNRFSYAHPEVMSLQRRIDLLIVLQYQFTQEEFARVADEAVHFQFNYLCRPQWTLVNYIAGDRRRVSVADIERKLARCLDYRYLPELIRSYCVDRGLAELTYEEFRSLIARIDAEIVVRHSASELAAMTRSLLSFVDHGMASPHTADNQPTLPINAAIVFYEDKGLEEVKTLLEHERDRNGKTALTIADLTTIIGQVWQIGEEGASLSSIASATPDPSDMSIPPPLEPSPSTAEQEPPHMADSATPAVPESPQPEKSPASVPLADLHEVFDPKRVKRFVRSIFNRNAMLFREALDMLNKCSSWEEASMMLDKLFVEQDVDPFSREAVEFTDVVYARYLPVRDQLAR